LAGALAELLAKRDLLREDVGWPAPRLATCLEPKGGN